MMGYRNLLFTVPTGTDSYKPSHACLYPPGSTRLHSYFECREKPFEWADEVVFFGLQYILERFRGQCFTKEDVHLAESMWADHFGRKDVFDADQWYRMFDKHHGYLPVAIRAVPEGTVVPIRNVLMTVENTDDEFPWLTNWLETMLSQIWYPITVATQSREMKRMLKESLSRTGDVEGLPFKLHDFGFRGCACFEQAGIGGAAHLVNFQGSDTFPGIMLARQFYGCQMAGFSIPASEHSTITSWGKEGELGAFANMLEEYPTGLIACVSDSYDIKNACRNLWGDKLKQKILERDGTLVVRPDSGEPVETVLMVLNTLGQAFGWEKNNKGYKVLPPQVRVIQGDGIDYHSLGDILNAINENGWSTDNIAFGSGGGLLQKVNRDTLSCAFKASRIEGEDFGRDVYKDPVGMSSKRSKRGRMKLVKYGNTWETVNLEDPRYDHLMDQLVEVFRDGRLNLQYTFDEIRKRAELV